MGMRVGVVGFGKMGMLHGALANSIEGMDLVAICDNSKLISFAFKSVKKEIKAYSNYKKMIDKTNPDAVIITTPTFSHFEVASFAIERNISVFIEKPVTRTSSEAKALYEMSRNKDVVTFVGFSVRYLPSMMRGKEIIDSGELGRIKKIRASILSGDVLTKSDGWRFKPQMSGGGVLIDLGIHMVDIVYWLFGQIESVVAEKKSIFSELVEDEVTAEFNFQNGLICEFATSWSKEEYRKSYPLVEVEGENATIKITDHVVELNKNGVITVLTDPDLYTGSYIDIGGICYSMQMQSFYNSLSSKAETETNIENAYYVQRVIDRIYESAEKNERVYISREG